MARRTSAIFAFCILLAGCDHADADAFPNVRLGMAARDVRERFQPGTDGSWQTALGIGDDTVLEWTAKDVMAPVKNARFEFHNGMLVAIRAHLTAAATKESVSSTPKTVTMRGPGEGGTSVTVLARDCPTHRDEADALVAKMK